MSWLIVDVVNLVEVNYQLVVMPRPLYTVTSSFSPTLSNPPVLSHGELI